MEGKLCMKIKSAKIVSVFDGMACGMLAFLAAGIKVDKYVAFEIDKYATKTAKHNFPDIEENGDVFQADFTKYEGFDFVVGGSPCTYWSIAQSSDKRETIASGIGWELFQQYVRCVDEVKPKWFIYENNKSMSNSIRMSITEAFGFEPVEINSALVSAQNRQRLYWVGQRNEEGTYDRIEVEQPQDRGILLRDILESGVTWKEKSTTIDAHYGQGINLSSFDKQSGQWAMVAERIPEFANNEKSRPVCWSYAKQEQGQVDKNCFSGNPAKQQYDYVCEPIKVGCYPSPDGTLKNSQAYRIYSIDGKATTQLGLSGGAGAKTGLYAMPVKEATAKGFTEIEVGECVDMEAPNSKTRRGRKMTEKSNCLTTQNEFYQYMGTIKAYEVKDGKIHIKGKEYPIKLKDGFYIIRKLTVSECKKLQTVPEWYEFPVSDTQSYKMLGNGWTVEVIAHLIRATQEGRISDKQLSFFD